MDELQSRHRREQRDLQSRITQKKKSATKKTRKGINAECELLETELNRKQQQELAERNETSSDIEDDNKEGDLHRAPIGDKAENSYNLDRESNETIPELEDHLESLSRQSQSVQQQEQPQSRKPNRQKARLARRAAEKDALVAQAAEEAAVLPDLREQERAMISKELDRLGLSEREIRPDGHCLYSAIADQLTHYEIDLRPQTPSTDPAADDGEEVPGYKSVRSAAADHITHKPDDFVPFLEEPLEEYTHKIRDTAEWGGQLELLALARTYGVEINVLQGDGRVEKVEPEAGAQSVEGRKLWLAYYRHHFGLGEHYNSLRKRP
ncbi:MAG: hypothetical protein M1837_000170 [Sclerophora amabilis]|nr:MAG: hypothetical protein M1837_000170 [Sclerophora amabilis]